MVRTCGLVLVVSAAFSQPIPVTGVEIRNIMYGDDGSIASVEFVNTGGRKLTAFAWGYRCTYRSGRTSLMGQTSQDAIDRPDPPPDIARRTVLDPGGVSHEDLRRLPRCGPEAILSDVQVRAAIYQDGAAEGDEEQIERILKGRRVRSEELQRWIERISALRKSASPAADAETLYKQLAEANLRSELDALKERAPEDGWREQIRRDIQGGLRALLRSLPKSQEPAAEVERMVARSEARAARLKQGSERRP